MFTSTLLLALAPFQTASTHPTDAPNVAWGVVWGDYDDDGLDDLYVLASGAPDRLLENVGDGSFLDVTEAAGLAGNFGSSGALWGDADADGRLDLLLVTARGEARFFRGAGHGLFDDASEVSGIGAESGVLAMEWLDYDRDGYPDLLLETGGGSRLLHNDRGAVFEAVQLSWARSSSGPGAVIPRIEPGEELLMNAGNADAEGRRSSRSTNASGSRTVAARRPGGRPASAVSPGPNEVPAGSPAPISPASIVNCIPMLEDQANPGTCLMGSSVPTLGKFYPLGTELNVSAATGRVGIGTTAPTHQLTVKGGSDDVARLMGTGPFDSGARLNLGDGDFVHLWEYADDRLEVKGDQEVLITAPGTGGEVNVVTRKLNVSASGGTRFVAGNVGIGTASAPAWPLDVLAPQAVARLQSSSSTNGSVLELRSQVASPSSIGAINFVNAAGQFNGQVAYSGSDDMTLRAGGSERVRIESGGNVGIGTTVPAYKLQVAGGFGFGAIFADSTSASGDGVFGRVSATTTGPGYGVRGESRAIDGHGVHAVATATSGSSHGVFGSSNSPDGFGVYGYNSSNATTGSATASGVYGEVSARRAQGVWGRNWDTSTGGTPVPVGVLGTCGSNGYALFSEGEFLATGGKSFAQPHPHDASKMVRFMCLEGNESGTYCRGNDALKAGVARIALPEDFRLASASERITAQVTSRGPAFVWVERVTREELVVRGALDVPFDWVVSGIRAGFEDIETIVDNVAFRPRVKGEPYLADRPESFRRLLESAGITNADGTPNEATAAMLGWDLLEQDDPRAAVHLPPDRRPLVEKPAPSAAPAAGRASAGGSAYLKRFRGQSTLRDLSPVLLEDVSQPPGDGY